MEGLSELLKSERLSVKVSIEEITKRTNIPEKIITALENNDYSKIPGKFYLKNFIKNYLIAINVDYKEFMVKYKELIDDIPFSLDSQNDYLYKMRYSKFKKKGVLINLLLILILIAVGYFLVYKNIDTIKAFLTPEKIENIKEIPDTGVTLGKDLPIIRYGFDHFKKKTTLLNDKYKYSLDRWAVDLVVIVNKKNWITVFQGGKKIIGRDFQQGEVLKLKGYSFSLHTQYASAIDVLLNGKELDYFKNKKGYQKLLISPESPELF